MRKVPPGNSTMFLRKVDPPEVSSLPLTARSLVRERHLRLCRKVDEQGAPDVHGRSLAPRDHRLKVWRWIGFSRRTPRCKAASPQPSARRTRRALAVALASSLTQATGSRRYCRLRACARWSWSPLFPEAVRG